MKKILILIIGIGLIFGLVGIGTQAYFSDVETSSVSIFTSGVWDNPKAITAFNFPEGYGTVNETDHTIAVTVPFGTGVTTLIPTIAFTGESVDPASDVAQDFTSPVTYTVTAADSSTQAYVVTVTVNTAPDTTAPVITAPADQTFEATGTETTPILVEATATDIVDPNPVITYTPHSFPVGDTTVTWTATDASGNASTATSKVTITDTTAPVIVNE